MDFIENFFLVPAGESGIDSYHHAFGARVSVHVGAPLNYEIEPLAETGHNLGVITENRHPAAELLNQLRKHHVDGGV